MTCQLCRCNVTTLIYATALSNKQFFSTAEELDMSAKGGNVFGLVLLIGTTQHQIAALVT